MMNSDKRIALLIDCENARANSIESVLAELKKYGTIRVRHAHGNWAGGLLSGWKDKLLPYSLLPMQQFSYTKGKNAVDIALVIDAMDLLHGNSVDAFAIMANDSDYTPLAVKICQGGFPVYGFGGSKASKAFVRACTAFAYTDKPVANEKTAAVAKITPNKGKIAESKKSPPPKKRDAGRPAVEAKSAPIEETIPEGGKLIPLKQRDAGRPAVEAKNAPIKEKTRKAGKSTLPKQIGARRIDAGQLYAYWKNTHPDVMDRPVYFGFLAEAVLHTAVSDGWSSMSAVVSYMSARIHEKNPRDFIRATKLFDEEMRKDGVYICPKGLG